MMDAPIGVVWKAPELGHNDRFKEDAMKKIMMLLGIAAAGYGAMKFFKGKSEDEYADQYAPQPQA